MPFAPVVATCAGSTFVRVDDSYTGTVRLAMKSYRVPVWRVTWVFSLILISTRRPASGAPRGSISYRSAAGSSS